MGTKGQLWISVFSLSIFRKYSTVSTTKPQSTSNLCCVISVVLFCIMGWFEFGTDFIGWWIHRILIIYGLLLRDANVVFLLIWDTCFGVDVLWKLQYGSCSKGYLIICNSCTTKHDCVTQTCMYELQMQIAVVVVVVLHLTSWTYIG